MLISKTIGKESGESLETVLTASRLASQTSLN